MPECTNCGSFVTPSFVRVFGGNDDQVRGCDSCMTQTELNSGIAAQSPGEEVPLESTDSVSSGRRPPGT
ncbi:DUF7563 family protein [Halorarum halobium]|uniref:DUF7563 family protein n=1 Tax=Halorarum halobium TaxID=3075121 RepID=UPI0028A97877|nr:hypothetical protein [Halobaculum sp. XH14]